MHAIISEDWGRKIESLRPIGATKGVLSKAKINWERRGKRGEEGRKNRERRKWREQEGWEERGAFERQRHRKQSKVYFFSVFTCLRVDISCFCARKLPQNETRIFLACRWLLQPQTAGSSAMTAEVGQGIICVMGDAIFFSKQRLRTPQLQSVGKQHPGPECAAPQGGGLGLEERGWSPRSP